MSCHMVMPGDSVILMEIGLVQLQYVENRKY